MFTGALSPISNRQDWVATFQVADADTDELIDLSAATIVFEVRNPNNGASLILATSDNGKIAVVDTGVFQLSIGRAELMPLQADTYDVGCTVAVNGETMQLIAG